MAVRALSLLFLLALLQPTFADACFGPKLFLGIPDDNRGQVLTSLVVIYVKEKTGVETERVMLEGKSVVAEIRAERLDYGFSSSHAPDLQRLLVIDGLPPLLSGPRPVDDLQFTTVVPALKRLQKLLKPADVAAMLAEVEKGALPMAAVRSYLQEKRWI